MLWMSLKGVHEITVICLLETSHPCSSGDPDLLFTTQHLNLKEERGQQEDQEFKIIFSYIVTLKSAWEMLSQNKTSQKV